MDCSPPGSSVHGDSPGKNPAVGGHVLPPGDLPDPGIKPESPALQADSSPLSHLAPGPPGKPPQLLLLLPRMPGVLVEFPFVITLHRRTGPHPKMWVPR